MCFVMMVMLVLLLGDGVVMGDDDGVMMGKE